MYFTTHFSARDGGYFCKVYTACDNLALTTDYHPTRYMAETYARSFIAWQEDEHARERSIIEGLLLADNGE